MFDKKHIVVFLKKENNSYTVVKTKRINPPIDNIRFKKGNTQNIDTNVHSYSKGLRLFYFIDVNNKKGGQLFFLKSQTEKMNAKTRDMLLSEKLIDQLTTNLHQTSFKERLLNLIIGGVIGGLIGFLVGGL